MTFGLVNVSFSLPEWHAVKNDFLWTLNGLKTNKPPLPAPVGLIEDLRYAYKLLGQATLRYTVQVYLL